MRRLICIFILLYSRNVLRFTFLSLEFENLFLLNEKYNNNCYLENCVQNLWIILEKLSNEMMKHLMNWKFVVKIIYLIEFSKKFKKRKW